MRDDLRTLGAGGGSSNEAIKLNSAALRGTLAQAIADGKPSFDDENVQLLKFHGSYQQDDRDERARRRRANREKAYQFMVRSRIPGGALTPEQYLVHDDLAQRYGNRTLRLTTRQGIQLHGVLKGNLPAAIRAINEALLSTLAACGDVNRNVMACPAPWHHASHALLQSCAQRIAAHLAPKTRAYHELWLDGERAGAPEPEPIYGPTYLPRKFKIAVASPGDNCVDAFAQDLAFVAELDGDALRGFTVLVGGGMGSTHGKAETFPRLATPLCFALPNDVLAIAETVVTIHRDFGDRKNRKHARLKYVVEEEGIAWVRGELERRLGRRVADPHEVAFRNTGDHLGWHPQGDGRWFLGVHVLAGRVADTTALQLRTALRTLVERYRPSLRITAQQNLIVAGVREADRAEIDALLRAHGVTTDPQALGILRDAMACPALPTCGLAVAEAERALPELLAGVRRELAELGLEEESIGIRITGCPNGCARPRTGEIGIVGRSLGLYDVFVGGDRTNTRLNVPFAQGVKRAELAATLRPAFERWKRERRAGETFGDFMQRSEAEACLV